MARYFKIKDSKTIRLAFVFTLLVFLVGCKNSVGAEEGQVDTSSPIMTVTMFNVGKADSILVQVGGKNVLVDTGLYKNGKDLINSLRAKNVKNVDQLYMTHPHADHIGGVMPILNNLSVKTIYDTGIINPDSKLYPMIIKKAKEKNIPVKSIVGPMTIDITPDAKFEVLWPLADTLSDKDAEINYKSVVMRLVYKKFSVMFTADSYKESEYNIMKKYSKDKLEADILKVAHHSSNTSTSYEWLKTVNPKVAIASYANKPGVEFGKYPNKKTLNRILDQGIKFYGTEENGNITITTDGNTYNVKADRGGAR